MRLLLLSLMVMGCEQPQTKNEYLVNISDPKGVIYEDMPKGDQELILRCFSFCQALGYPGPNTIHNNGCFCKGSK